METPPEIVRNELVEWTLADLAAGRADAVSGALEELHPTETARLLEAMPPEHRKALWKAVPSALEGEVLSALHDEARATIIGEMEETALISAAESMDVADLADVIQVLPVDVTETVLDALDRDHRGRLDAVLAHEEGSAGRLMTTDVVSVRTDVTLAVVLRWLRRHQSLPPYTDALMVIDAEGRYLGRLPLADVVTLDPERVVGEVMRTDADVVRASASEDDVAGLFERRNLTSIAVLDDVDHLLGRITVDDAVNVIRRQAEHVLMGRAGLDEEEDLFSPVIPSARRRGLWLGINLVTVFMAAWVIGRFEEALDKIVALAVLMPVVASMGGIAGSQTLTLTIRGMALNQIASSNLRWLTVKEFAVGALNGVVWALVVAVVAYLWFRDPGIAIIIGAAMVLNLLAAALSGVTVPLLLARLGIDPALSGAVVLTTVTDVVGFLSFLGLATLFLL